MPSVWLRRLIAVCLAGLTTACQGADAPTLPRRAALEVLSARSPVVGTLDVIGDTVPAGKYIVLLRSSAGDVDTEARRLAERHQLTLRFVYRSVLRGFSAKMSAEAAAALSRSPEVEYVEPVTIIHPTSPGSASAPYYNLDYIDQGTLTRDHIYAWDQDGSGVIAYILDSGINTSLTEFGGRAQTLADFTDQSGGWGADCGNHGTSVATLLGGATLGVARNVQLRSVRVLGCSVGVTDWAVAGMDWIRTNGTLPAVVNMSWGQSRSTAINAAVQSLENAGFRTVVAAGNDNASAYDYSPASANTTFTVGNAAYTGSSMTRAATSNYGAYVGIWASGESVPTLNSSGQFTFVSGTSVAAPQVGGWAAIYLASDPFVSKYTLTRYALAVTKIPVANTVGSIGKYLYTRLDFVSWINEANASIPAGSPYTFTSSQVKGLAPYTFTWKQNGTVVCSGGSSCTLWAPGTPGYADIITLSTVDAAGRISTDTQYLNATCQDGGYSC